MKYSVGQIFYATRIKSENSLSSIDKKVVRHCVHSYEKNKNIFRVFFKSHFSRFFSSWHLFDLFSFYFNRLLMPNKFVSASTPTNFHNVTKHYFFSDLRRIKSNLTSPPPNQSLFSLFWWHNVRRRQKKISIEIVYFFVRWFHRSKQSIKFMILSIKTNTVSFCWEKMWLVS